MPHWIIYKWWYSCDKNRMRALPEGCCVWVIKYLNQMFPWHLCAVWKLEVCRLRGRQQVRGLGREHMYNLPDRFVYVRRLR